MRVAILALSFLLTGVPMASFAAVNAAPAMLVGHSYDGEQSVNWAGYAVSEPSGGVTSVSGSWVVPRVTCTSTATSSAFWVGIDGYTSSTVEQTGTDSDCSHGSPSYYAWYEFYPKGSKTIGSITVSPGDVIEADVVWNSGHSFTATIKDVSNGQSFSTTGTDKKAPRTSAEFITEAPETCTLLKCKLTTLSDFGTVGFGTDNGGVTACTLGVGGSVADLGTFGSAIEELTMVSQSNSNVVKAQPSALSADGTSFTVQWLSGGP